MWRTRRNRNDMANVTENVLFSTVAPIPVHRQTQQPSPGAMSYAYDTLALPAFTPIGAGVSVHHIPLPLQPQPVYAMQAVFTSGFGVRTGTVWHQGLFDENTGTMGAGMPDGPSANVPQFA